MHIYGRISLAAKLNAGTGFATLEMVIEMKIALGHFEVLASSGDTGLRQQNQNDDTDSRNSHVTLRSRQGNVNLETDMAVSLMAGTLMHRDGAYLSELVAWVGLHPLRSVFVANFRSKLCWRCACLLGKTFADPRSPLYSRPCGTSSTHTCSHQFCD
jgi:hypothetical protein